MRTYPVVAVLVCMTLFAACCSDEGSAPEKKAAAPKKAAVEKKQALSDPAGVAGRFLQAFKKKDVETLKGLSAPMMRMALWPDESAVKRQFDSWGDDVARWDGKTPEVRYRKEMMPYEEALACFADDENKFGGDKVVVLVMHHFQSEDWVFSTFETIEREKFMKYSKTPLGK